LDAGCPVIGVLGCGVDVVYPRHNRKLFEAVVQNGCLISEYPPEAQGIPWHFPARNRIISGMSNGTLIVEAPKVSGALITARWALEQGRDVFVVPGNINTITCEGSNALLQEGAMPVFSGWDVVRNYEVLYPGKLQKTVKSPSPAPETAPAKVAQSVQIPKLGEDRRKKIIDNEENSTYSVLENKKPALSDEEQAVLAQLTCDPREASEVIAKLEMSSGKVMSVLTTLTIKGLAVKYPGGRFSLK
jgi:DNA processing protein